MYITNMYKYKDEQGHTIVSGILPDGIVPFETMTILNAQEGYDLIRIATNENVGSSVWLRNEDKQENYKEVERIEEIIEEVTE